MFEWSYSFGTIIMKKYIAGRLESSTSSLVWIRRIVGISVLIKMTTVVFCKATENPYLQNIEMMVHRRLFEIPFVFAYQYEHLSGEENSASKYALVAVSDKFGLCRFSSSQTKSPLPIALQWEECSLLSLRRKYLCVNGFTASTNVSITRVMSKFCLFSRVISKSHVPPELDWCLNHSTLKGHPTETISPIFHSPPSKIPNKPK